MKIRTEEEVDWAQQCLNKSISFLHKLLVSS